MNASLALERAEGMLPGEPVAEGRDPRWQALVVVGRHIQSEPETVWELVESWGGDSQEDLRDAVALCLVEPLLETHFADFFPLVNQKAITDPFFADMVLRCQRYGQACEGANSKQFEALQRMLSEKFFD